MMCTKQEGVRGRLRALAVAPAMLAAMFVVNLDAVASIQTKASHVSLSLMSESAYENTAENETVAAAHNDSDSKVNKTISENATPAKEDNAPEVLPSFPGGEDAFYRYMILNMKYPQEAVDANEQGKVVVNFTITSKGEVTDPKIIQSVSPSLDAEALRIVNSMPLWNPGTVDGKPVNCTYTCPINFRLAPARNKTK